MRRWLAVSALLGLACDPDSRACRTQFDDAQGVVRGIKSDSIDSVKASVSALDSAIAVCEKAKLGHERDELKKARNQVGAHLEVLERRAARRKKAKPTPEELAELVKNGDPTCPKGQGYRHALNKQEIKCTGPQVIDMGFEDIKEYFADRKYKLITSDSPPSLKAEYGSELFVFEFDKPNDTQGPRCMKVYPAPAISWLDIVSRMTGTDPEKLKPGTPIKSVRGPLELKVESTENKVVARVGQCP